MAEYRIIDEAGSERVIVQPRVLAQTQTIERHVIRSEVPGIVVDVAAPTTALSFEAGSVAVPSEAGVRWRAFVDALVAEVRFEDPAQPLPRMGGVGWIRLPLPAGPYVNESARNTGSPSRAQR